MVHDGCYWDVMEEPYAVAIHGSVFASALQVHLTLPHDTSRGTTGPRWPAESPAGREFSGTLLRPSCGMDPVVRGQNKSNAGHLTPPLF